MFTLGPWGERKGRLLTSGAQWNFLRDKIWQGEEGVASGQVLVDRLYLESEKQKALEASGYRCLT